MNGIPRLKLSGPAALLLALASWAAAPAAVAECSCMCVDGVSYEVCTGIVTTQAQTEECTAALQCPAEPEPTEPEDPPADDTTDTVDSDIDCRKRNVYRPDLGRYKEYTVCMPAAWSAAHERRRAKRRELADGFIERHGEDHPGRRSPAKWDQHDEGN